MKSNNILLNALFLMLIAVIAAAQSGGNYTITESVMASGGNRSAGGDFALDSTTGQPTSGGALRGNPFAITGGFWNFSVIPPTAAQVSVSGRVMTATGQGIRGVIMTLTAMDGSTQNAISSSFGHYRFDHILAGETYILSVSSKRFTFSLPSIVVSVLDEITDLDFIADPL